MIREDSFQTFPSLTFTQSSTFSADFQVHFVADLEAFEQQHGQFLRQELELDGLLRVRKRDLDAKAVDGSARLLFVVDKQTLEADDYLSLLGRVFLKLKQLRVASLDMGLPSKVDHAKLGYYAECMNYFYELKNQIGKDAYFRIEAINFVAEQPLVGTEDFRFYRTVGIYKSLARDFANGRSNIVGVQRFLDDARARVDRLGRPDVRLTIFQGDELLKERLNLIHAVGKGSCQAPALLNLSYNGDPSSEQYFAAVGKGIVFDQGGMDYKKTASIAEMYNDKGGGANVYAIFWAAVELGLKVNLTASVALAHNNVSEKCYRTSDIITSHAGLTVQVKNTDAEGRLVLADAMSWTQTHFKVTHLYELSTLTGAIGVALGDHLGGVFTNSDTFASEIAELGEQMAEPMHVLPITRSAEQALDSPQCDVNNVAQKTSGGAMIAAGFLKRFVHSAVQWIHMDIGSSNDSHQQGLFTQAECTSAFGVAAFLKFLQAHQRK